MKQTLLLKALILFLTANFAFATTLAQIPDWTDTSCNGSIYRMYDELAAGHAVILDFTAMWCQPSNICSPILDTLYKAYGSGSGNLVMFDFLVQNLSQNATTCSNVALYQAQRHVSFPGFANCSDVHSAYLSAYHDSAFPLILMYIPNVSNPSASSLVFNSNHDLNTLDSLSIQLNSLLTANGFFPTGINEVETGKNSLTVYPNPARGQLTLVLNDLMKKAPVKVLNTAGQEIYSAILPDTSATAYELKLNTPPGIYFVQVSAGSRLYTQKLVIE